MDRKEVVLLALLVGVVSRKQAAEEHVKVEMTD